MEYSPPPLFKQGASARAKIKLETGGIRQGSPFHFFRTCAVSLRQAATDDFRADEPRRARDGNQWPVIAVP